MRSRSVAAAFSFVLCAASAATAQQPAVPAAAAVDQPTLTHLQTAVACAISPRPAPFGPDPLTIVGSQDTTVRSLFGPRDLLVISGGTARQVQLGQRYFVRRLEWFGPRSSDRPYTVRTGGWIRIVAANEATAIGVVEYSCSDILTGDYLEPFVLPVVPASAETTVTTGTLDFTHLGRVLYGDHLRWTAGSGGYMLVDRGTGEGASVGARYAVYRDLRQDGVPLVAIGEVVVVSAGPDASLVRITDARDVITTGDYIVPRR